MRHLWRKLFPHVSKTAIAWTLTAASPSAGDAILVAVDDRTFVLPRFEYGADSSPQLFMGILREGRTSAFLNQRFVTFDQVFEIFSSQFVVEFNTCFVVADFFESDLERAMFVFSLSAGTPMTTRPYICKSGDNSHNMQRLGFQIHRQEL